MNHLYEIKEIDYSYMWNRIEVPIFKGMNLNLEQGCFCCVQGPSGTGKTTLLNLLGFIDRPLRGEIFFLGEKTTALSETEKEKLRLKSIGFVFQSFYLIPTLNVLENTSYFLGPLGYSRDKAEKWSSEVLDLLGLKDHRYKKPLELSGGQRQRVAIARALVKKPKVILADEPTANLDSETASTIIQTFTELQKIEKTSFIFSTHDPHLVKYAHQIYKVQDGKVFPLVKKTQDTIL